MHACTASDRCLVASALTGWLMVLVSHRAGAAPPAHPWRSAIGLPHGAIRRGQRHRPVQRQEGQVNDQGEEGRMRAGRGSHVADANQLLSLLPPMVVVLLSAFAV